jgi:hypothetical protein
MVCLVRERVVEWVEVLEGGDIGGREAEGRYIEDVKGSRWF